MSRSFLAVIVLLLVALTLSLALVQASPAETVQAARDGDRIALSNDAIAATWSVRGASLQWLALANHLTGANLPLAGSVFALVPGEGELLRSSDLKMIDAPVIEGAPVSPGSSKAADHTPGRQVRIELEDASARLHISWRAILREGANYIRQEVTLKSSFRAM
jgi:hypothetical protein